MKLKWTALSMVVIALMILMFEACKREKELPQVAVNPEFEMHPPLAGEVSISFLENNGTAGNLLVVADFGKGTIKGQYHAINLGDDKVVFRDDGSGGDEKADDGKFSIIIQEDLEALKRDLEELERNKEQIIEATKFEFKGRHVVAPDFSELREFTLKDFKPGKLFRFPKNFFCKLLLDVSIPHSLLVTNVATVEYDPFTAHPCEADPTVGGPWTFEKLVTDMANQPVTGVTVEVFVKDWLETWLNDATVNSELVEQRDNLFANVISPWVIASGSPPGTFTITNWRTRPLNLAKAPFKLIAIVNRLDLRGNMAYGISNAGEGRFVFEVVNSSGCAPIAGQFTVIFEYGIPIKSCKNLVAYGQRWYNLKNLALGSAVYNDSLKRITDVFASANADPSKPNGSSLNQIRTNERAIGSPWELREFNIDPASHKLFITTVKQEPAEKYNGAGLTPGTAAEIDRLKEWINNNEIDILADKHQVTPTFPTSEPFLGGRAHSEPGLWNATGITNLEARHHFSFNTCSGCHQQETGTPFVHLSTVGFGAESVPSGFLSGITQNDPVSSVPHSFNDLANRQVKLENLLCNGCPRNFRGLVMALTFDPIRMEH